MRRLWRFAFRRTLGTGLYWVARVRLEYRPPTWVDLPVTAHSRAIVCAWYHGDYDMQIGLETQIFFFVVLFLSIIIHEVAHGYSAYMLGDPTAKLAKRLTLNPFRHIDLFGSIIVPILCVLSPGNFLFGWAKPVPYNPYNLKNQRWGEAIVAISGVATNFFLAILFAVIARAANAYGMDTYAQLAYIIILVNLSLGLLNLIPIPPLDGYTFLRGLLPLKSAMAFRDFEDRVRQGGFLTLIVFFLVFSYVLAGPFSALVYWFFRLLVGV